MAQRTVTEIVTEAGELQCQRIDRQLVLPLQQTVRKDFGKVPDADAVLETSMCSAREHMVNGSELLDAFQALKFGRVYYCDQALFPVGVSMDGAVNGFGCHFFRGFFFRDMEDDPIETDDPLDAILWNADDTLKDIEEKICRLRRDLCLLVDTRNKWTVYKESIRQTMRRRSALTNVSAKAECPTQISSTNPTQITDSDSNLVSLPRKQSLGC